MVEAASLPDPGPGWRAGSFRSRSPLPP